MTSPYQETKGTAENVINIGRVTLITEEFDANQLILYCTQ
jgi:hypothetical protein